MSRQDPQDFGADVQDSFLSPPTVSDTENDALNYNTLTSSPIVSVEPWLGINSDSKLWLHCECTYTDGTPGLIELAEAVPVDTSTGAQAFSCELPLDELSKLADNTLITIILMVSTTGTLEKQSLNATRYELMFQRPITLTNYSRWMTDIGSDIDHLKIHDLILPEAHNAGVDQKGAGWPTDQWGACQDDTFTYQLRNGIRALDLRLYRDLKEMYTHKEYIFKHGSYHSRRYLNDCIHGVLEFAEQNPREIVILDFHETVLLEGERDVARTLSMVLGNRCIPRTAMALTVGQIRNRHPGRNVIIAWNLSPQEWFCWPKVAQTWTGRDFNDADALRRHANEMMADPPRTSLPWSLFAAGYNDLGPIRFGSNAVHWNSFFNAATASTYRQPTKGNLINVDFFAGTGVVDRCIKATKDRAHLAARSAPRNLIVSNITTNSIKLRWTRPSETETPENYRVFFNRRHAHATSNTEYEFTGLKDGATYDLVVIPHFSSGDGAPAEITATTIGIPDTTKPSKPSELKFIFFDGTSNLALLSWVASTDNIAVTRYEIYGDGVQIGTVEIPQYTYFTINPNNKLTYTVRALDAAGNFADSDPLTLNPDQLPPSKPTNVRASAITANSVTLEWTPSSDNVAVIGYQLFRNNTPIDTVNSTFYIDRGLTSGTSYIYKVRALDAAGNFTDSDPLTVTLGDTTAPTKPTHLRTTVVSFNFAILEWSRSSDNVAVTGYQIFRNGTPIGSTGSESSYVASGLASATTYSFKVRALDAAGNFADSDPLTVTTLGATGPTKPTHLRSTFVSFNFAILEWTPSSDNVAVTGYQIFRDGAPTGSVTGSESNYAASGLTSATTYSFKVRALDADGNFADSEPISVRTPG